MNNARPNILLILCDQLHPDCLGYAGHPLVQTPNLDRLAASGRRFDRMYTPSPMCMPARASLFTGMMPSAHRVRMNGIPLDPAIPTFTERLRVAGYRTHCSGKIHLQLNATPEGMDPAELDPAAYPESAALWLDGRIDRLPSPYYGFESADFYGGCAYGSYGPYLDWLRAEHPESARAFFDRSALEPPGPAAKLFNRNAFKWALPAAAHPAHWIADRAIDFIGSDHDRPFCLVCSFQEPHPPFAPPAEYANRHRPEEVPPARGRAGELDGLPPHFRRLVEEDLVSSGNNGEAMNRSAPHRAEIAALYYGLIELLDDQVGRVLDALEAAELDEETVVVFLADHGEALGDHGLWGKGPYHFDPVIRVPCILSWPETIEEDSRCVRPCSLVDLAPTLLSLADVESSERNLLASSGDSVVVEMDDDYLGLRLRTLVTGRYRMTRYLGEDFGELFDLEADPDELHNLWDDAAHADLRAGLQSELSGRLPDEDPLDPLPRARA